MKKHIATGLLFAATFFIGFAAIANAETPKISDENEAKFAEIAKLEQAKKWNSALKLAETFYETAPEDEAARLELRKIFERLRPKVAPNKNRKKAGVWRVKAFAFRTLDFERKDENGAIVSTKWSYDDAEIKRIRRCVAGFADYVWEYSDGSLRIDWTFDVVDTPLRELEGFDGRYWPGPSQTIPLLPQIEQNSADTIVVFVKTSGGPESELTDAEKKNAPIPLLLLGGALGEIEPLTLGATYIAFNWGTETAANEPDGEPLLHEWLHSLQWTLEERQKYPTGLAGDPDGGRFVGENREGGDPCYRRDPAKESTWIEFYRHIMRTHTTRKMLREAPEREVKFRR